MEHVQKEDAFSADYAKPHISGVASIASDRREGSPSPVCLSVCRTVQGEGSTREGSTSHEEEEVGVLPVAGLCKVRDQPLDLHKSAPVRLGPASDPWLRQAAGGTTRPRRIWCRIW